MSLPKAKVMVWVDGANVWLRITGHANFTVAPDFKRLLHELHDKGYRRFLVDLSQCVLLDSTFLGLLCGLGVKLHQSGSPEAGVDLLNPPPRIVQLLENLGVCQLLRIVHTPPAGPAPASASESPLGQTPADRAELARTSLEAHQVLMQLSPANEARFKDVARFLAEDLQKLESPNPTAPEKTSTN
ncbi:STAS domain-containing protein [Limisphaera sp. VF-2]|jgi:anti-sigma B factor antagonist|uniref:STAS domain-containing protein n=1 Tax=Limisphaera sp. VF-2 TaxID=3400418 RepID=UPI00176990A2|nr:STAS domain-containing protein [Limisphaera sp.]